MPGAALEPIAAMVLGWVHREYPHQLAHRLESDADARPPRALTPAFHGGYDWHSAVHGHWCLARLARLHPDAAFAPAALAALERSLTPERLAGEVEYLGAPGRAGFERPYGLAWLLQLAAELREWGRERAAPAAARARGWSAAALPLERLAAARLAAWLPRLARPIRSGEHSQSAFAMGLALDWARGAGAQDFEALAVARARAFHLDDRDAPVDYEPSGHDFLSPVLAEADLMRRVLEPAEFGGWLEDFLPDPAGAPARRWLTPVEVGDREDGKLAHLDGLHLSRAWMLEGVVAALDRDHPWASTLDAAALRHREAGLAAVPCEHEAGAHWLGSFAVYLVTGRGRSQFGLASAPRPH